MKAIFNIAKNVRNSRSISALNVLIKLQSIGLLACALLIGSLQVWGTDIVINLDLSNAATYPNDFPTATGTTSGSHTLGGYTFTFSCNTGYYKGAQNAYLMIGQCSTTEQTASIITFPAIADYKLTEVQLTTTSGGATALSLHIGTSFSSAISGGSAWTYARSTTKTWTLTSTSANTAYKLYVKRSGSSGTKNCQIEGLQLTYEPTAAPCANSVTVSDGGSSTHGSITSITTSPVATCSGTATDRQVSILVTPSTGYIAPTDLTVGTKTGTVTSTKVSRTDNGNGTFTFVYRYNQNDNGSISYNATCVGKQCTVTFDKNSGTGGDNSVTATYGSAMTTITPPTREHYDFEGYYDGAGGTGNKYYNADGTSAATWNKNTTSNTTLYAKWTEHSLTNYRTTCCTELGTPANLNATPSGVGGTVYWDAVDHADGYEVSIDGGSNWSSTNTNSYTITGQTCGGNTVNWMVRATGTGSYCANGPSASSSFTTSACACSYYQFHYQHNSDWNMENICFTPISSGNVNYLTDELALPIAEWYNVTGSGAAGHGASDAYTYGFTGTTDNVPMHFFHKTDKSFGANPQVGNLGGGLGRFHVYGNSDAKNKYVSFIPTGYTLNFGSGVTWVNDLTLNFTGNTSAWNEAEWYTDITTLTDAQIGKQVFVGLQTTNGYVWCDPYSQKDNLNGLRTKTGADSWLDGGMSTSYAEKTGKFRIYANSGDKNWYVTFVPYYRLTYNANSGTGAPSASGYVSCEGNAAARTIAISATEPTRVGYRFMGWATSPERAAAGTVDYKYGTANDEVVLTGSLTLYAVWKQLFEVSYDYDGGSGSCAGGYYIQGETVTVCASNPTKAGCDFNGWSYSPSVTVTTGTFPMPASDVEITATWVDHTYTLTHAGTGTKTNTEGKTTIKSSDTPLTLHYTCTGTNAFPLNDVSISGGGKATWTRNTHFTWEVGSDKQTATLVITPATTITADVTITINMKTRYTVIWDEHGVQTTVYKASDDNTVAEKTGIADCGEKKFYWWTEDAIFTSDDDTPPTEATFGTISGDKHYYAIYADAVVPQNPGYNKVTTISAGTYLIATTGQAYTGKVDGQTYGGNTSVSVSEGVISTKPATAVEVTVTLGTGANSSKFDIYDGTYHLGYGNKSLAFGNSQSIEWQLTAEGYIQCAGNTDYTLQYNAGNPRFACYSSSQTKAYLYKKETTTYEKFSKTCETYDITIDPGITGGTVTTTPAAGTDVAGEGQEITVNVTPNSCKYLSALSYNDGEDDHAISIASTPYTFDMPAADVTVTATFSNKSVSSITPITNSHRILMEGTSFVGEDIRVTYNNGETADLAWNASGLSFTGYNMSSLGNQTVTVSYTSDCGNASTTYSITISDGIPVTFSDCGVTTTEKYDPGEVVPVETTTGAYACAGWQFVGWSATSVAANSTSFTPVRNFEVSTARTLYAVYADTSDVWLSALDATEMRSGATYVIVHPYSSSDHYSLNNTDTLTNYLTRRKLGTPCEKVREPGTYKDRFKLKVSVANAQKWFIYKDGDYWKVQNIANKKYLQLNSDGSAKLTNTVLDEFSFSDNNNDESQVYLISHNSSKYLSHYNSGKYWNAHTSGYAYFCTNMQAFSSNPPCAPLSATFHGSGGTVVAKTGTPTGDDLTITEASRDAGIYLPTAETDASDCDGKTWDFIGWIDHEVDVTRVPILTTDLLNDGYDKLNPNPLYHMAADNEEYWAVYTNTGDPETKYGTISFTMLDFPKTYNTTEATLTKSVGGVGDYTFAYYQTGHASDLGIQINHDPAGYIKNTTSLGKINKITFSSFGTGSVSDIRVYVGNTADAINTLLPSSCLQTVSGTSTYYPNGNYQFVKIQYTAYVAVGTISIDFGRGTEVWATTPDCSTLSLSGTVRVTSTNGKRVKAVTPITVSGHGLAANAAVSFAAYNASDDTPNSHFTFIGSASADINGDVSSTNIVVAYQPTETSDGTEEVYFKASASNGSGTTESGKLTGYGRHLPAKFVIATKVSGNWYALPNNVTDNSYGTRDLIPITVDNTTTPTTATVYTSTTDYLAWGMNAAGTSTDRYTTDGEKISFVSAINSKGLSGNASGLRNSAALPATTSGDYLLFDWTPATTDLVSYTLQNGSVTTYYVATNGSDQWNTATTGADVRFLIYDEQPAATITWYNDMLDADHSTNKAENGVVTLPTGADPVSCNSTLLPTFCGWKDGAIATYVTSAPTYVQAGDAATTDKTYYAVFKHATLDRWYTDCPTIYTITYTANGGTGADHLEYTMNTTADAITVGAAGFSKEGCTFVGWTNPDDVDGTIITPGAGKITGLTGDITLNAVWIGTTTVTGTVRLTASAGEKVATGATDVTISSTDLACATALRITYKDVTNDVTYGRSGTPSYTSSEFRLCNGSYGAADLSNISLAEVSGAYNQTFSITYEPNGGANTLDEYQLKVEVLLKNTVIDTKTLSLYGRTLPASFAIAIKVGGSWYALPNNMDSEGTYDPILISVTEDASVLNWTAQGPSTVAYKMKHYSSNYSKLRFAANDATENCLWAATGNSASIRNWSPSSTATNYAWTVTPDANFNVYSMANLANTRTALKIYDGKWEMYNSGGLSDIHFIPLTTVTPITVTVMEWGVDEIAVKAAANWTPSAITAQISGGSPSAVTKTSIGGDLYKLTGVGDLQGNPGEPLALNVTDGGAKQAIIQIPFIVTDTKTEAQLATILKDAGYAATLTEARDLTKNMDVIVRRNGTLSSSSSTSGTFQNVYIYPGGKADFTKDISIQNIYMRGGFSWLGGAYAHPQMNVASTASISGIGATGHGIFYDLYLDNSIYYVFALPKDVAVSDITNEENGDDWDAWIKSYSGEGRTLSPKESGWNYVTSGSIARGAGYEIAIKPRLNRPYGILRFPLLKSTKWSAETDCSPEVTGWGANNTNVSDNNKGWNFIGNPFLTAYNNSATPGSTPGGLIQTNTLVQHKPDGEHWDGKYEWSTSNVKYFTIPRYTEYEYDDIRAYPYQLDAFFPFFIQVTGDGTVSFDDANKSLKAPARYAEEPEREVFVDFQLSNSNGQTDVAGLTISDQYSDAFDMNDKEKTIQNGNSAMKVYTLVGEYRTAFNALTEATAALPIPVGYIAPVTGTYRFAKLENADYSEVEHLWLTDYMESSLVDLLVEPFYEFTTEAGRIENRFAINATLKPKQETPTGTEQWNAEDERPIKFIWQDKMYIFRGGVIYDATGKRVMEINK